MNKFVKITINKSVNINAGGAALGRIVEQTFGGEIGGALGSLDVDGLYGAAVLYAF